jgi:hypothetical protein
LQSFDELPGMQAEGGDEAGGEAGDGGNRYDEGERPPVEVNLLRTGDCDLRVLQPDERGPGEEQTESSAGDRGRAIQ